MKNIMFNNQLLNQFAFANRHSVLDTPSLREGRGGLNFKLCY